MDNLKAFLGFLVGTAVFVYLIGSFLIASFDISVWKDGDRFITVVIYLLLVWASIKAFTESQKPKSKSKKEEAQTEHI